MDADDVLDLDLAQAVEQAAGTQLFPRSRTRVSWQCRVCGRCLPGRLLLVRAESLLAVRLMSEGG